MADEKPTIEPSNEPTQLEVLSKRLDDLELSINVLNPRNMAGLRTKDLQQATRANLFGDGSDGTVVVSTEINLERDMFYNNLTVKSTGIINTKSFRIFCKDTFTKDPGGIIRNNGNIGGNGEDGDSGGVINGGTAGTAVASGSLSGGVAGGAGGNGSAQAGAAGTAGIDTAKSLGSAGSGGGGGGAGNSNAGGAGGAGGSQTGTVFNIPKSFNSSYYLFDYLPSVVNLTLSAGSGAGGGGGGDGTRFGGAGGGSGSPAGMIWIAGNKLLIEGENEIQCIGGVGGNGGVGHVVGGSGGGGGGGAAGGDGGVIMLIYGEKTGTGTLLVAGGAKGTGGTGKNSGGNGTAGATGKTYNIIIA